MIDVRQEAHTRPRRVRHTPGAVASTAYGGTDMHDGTGRVLALADPNRGSHGRG